MAIVGKNSSAAAPHTVRDPNQPYGHGGVLVSEHTHPPQGYVPQMALVGADPTSQTIGKYADFKPYGMVMVCATLLTCALAVLSVWLPDFRDLAKYAATQMIGFFIGLLIESPLKKG